MEQFYLIQIEQAETLKLPTYRDFYDLVVTFIYIVQQLDLLHFESKVLKKTIRQLKYHVQYWSRHLFFESLTLIEKKSIKRLQL